ncbi:thioredoxin domain-containing protein [Qiania dongpingensis]|uniref:Thioredoxin domain-containing protein n=1 Tax=Qiania dongpingensis TaxID=2763669 RepID=A0A7G9G0I0_9FIRM|nr:thioredoxin domain-containing protein [Qiania dongpingensis]QNM04312.1 thioredoxin domain-containing protein [Qiania dongpingensis]
MNHLKTENSPYLLQHAENPVDWYPWGKEAFQKASEEKKPIFLSIGYSTCHWCHVMAHESFEDEEVAAVLNRSFISIKVDREERPDVDAVYMEFCQALTGSGGWPLTVIMSPDQQPFYVDTYLPKNSHYGKMGLLALLEAVENRWKNDRSRLLDAGDQITRYLKDNSESKFGEASPAASHSERLTAQAAAELHTAYDSKWGGFGNAPKFPIPHNLLFLMRYSKRVKNDWFMEMAENTLVKMVQGGLFDHIGGGFSRYSTDRQWLVPHFEKMLYDNALLALSFLEAYSITQKTEYKTAARRTFHYIFRELTGSQGEFFCGQDADSDGVEGKYYVFTPEEIKKVLGTKSGEDFCHKYHISVSGNFEGKNIPNLTGNSNWETQFSQDAEEKESLYQYRRTRCRLHLDDKVLTAWNGLMILALAKGYSVLGDLSYLRAAIQAKNFIEDNMTSRSGGLFLSWRNGTASVPGQLGDYACYLCGLLSLYEASFEAELLLRAEELAQIMQKLFEDTREGGYYLYGQDSETLILRPKETYDGALPSGNSMAAIALQKLAHLSGKEAFRALAEKQMLFMRSRAKERPSGHSMFLLAQLAEEAPVMDVICVTADTDTKQAAAELHDYSSRHPEQSIHMLLKTPENAAKLAEAAPFTSEYPLPPSGTLYYICRNGACSAPVYSLEETESRNY